jgi:hypothetical protein
MALNNFLKIYLPYGVTIHKDNTITVFNREYMPLGYNEIRQNCEINGYNRGGAFLETKLPIRSKLKKSPKITNHDEFWEEIAHDGKVHVDGDLRRVFLYNDGSVPSNFDLSSEGPIGLNIYYWDEYFRRIKKLAVLQIEQG